MKVTVHSDLSSMQRIGEKMRNPGALAARIAGYMQQSTARTFAEEGVPKGLWRATTKMGRAGIPRKVLTVTGALRRSVFFTTSAPQGRILVEAESKSSYAALHQYGGVRTAPPGRPFKFQIWTGRGFRWMSAKTVRTPATPFLVFRPEDPANLRSLVMTHLLQ